jgi:hypothetical protein
LLNPEPGRDVDHISGDPTDNRRANLRICSRSANASNQQKTRGKSAYRGVTHHKQSGRWHAEIRVRGRRVFIGSFKSERSAALRYNAVARREFGSFAHLNVFSRKAVTP